MSFVAIHISDFPVAAWLRASEGTLSGAAAILEGDPPQQRIVAQNEAARRAGLARGMSRSQAEAMCSLTVRSRQIAEEELAFAALLQVAERFSPRVQAIASPSNAYRNDSTMAASLVLDATGTRSLFGDVNYYAGRLQRELAAAGFPASMGAAPDASSALLFSRSGRNIVCMVPAQLRARLAPLPVSLLDCEPRLLAVLHRWGIRTLGELAALPETSLVSRMGQAGHSLQQVARGEAGHLLVPEEEAFTLCDVTVLDTPVELLDSLLFVLSPMLEALMRKAVERAYALRAIRLTLELEGAPPHTNEVRPAVPTQHRETLLKLMNLELQAHPPQAPIVCVTLQGEAAQPQVAQRGLFQAQFPEPGRLDLLLARLRSIAGEHHVGSPRLSNSHQFDRFTLAPFQPKARTAPDNSSARHTRVALRIVRPAHMVRVTCWADRPRMVFWQGSRLSVASCAGPWRSSGSWWDGHAWDESFWDVVTAEPIQSLRLMHAQTSNQWFIVGMYD